MLPVMKSEYYKNIKEVMENDPEGLSQIIFEAIQKHEELIDEGRFRGTVYSI